MRYLLLMTLSVIACLQTISAQEYEVLSFEVKQNDITARTNSRVDANGRKCAVVKVYADDKIATVRGAVVGDVESIGMEKQIYMAHDAKQMELVFENHYPLTIVFMDYDIPSLTGQMTYICKLMSVASNKSKEMPREENKSTVTAKPEIYGDTSSPIKEKNETTTFHPTPISTSTKLKPYSGSIANFEDLIFKFPFIQFQLNDGIEIWDVTEDDLKSNKIASDFELSNSVWNEYYCRRVGGRISFPNEDKYPNIILKIQGLHIRHNRIYDIQYYIDLPEKGAGKERKLIKTMILQFLSNNGFVKMTDQDKYEIGIYADNEYINKGKRLIFTWHDYNDIAFTITHY